MSRPYTVAKFWKCALQVNPASYIVYRGQNHGLTEEDYNNRLVEICKELDIKIIGLADHGNVDSVDTIRTIMLKHDIIVFPGFEISSSEKAHFVCLFPEDTSKDQLNRFLGKLDLTNLSDDVRPSSLTAVDLIKKVNELGGFIYAAHATHENGILKQKLQHAWMNPLLKAVQIPGAKEDIPENYKNIILNTNPEYKRESAIGIINAKDVALPDDLKYPSATCLIKMTTPCFQAFKIAFLDPESRIRLNHEVKEYFYSRIESVAFTGGFLNGITIAPFSDHLNTIIGGRGTGKSTILECIRYVLNKHPKGKDASRKHDEIIKENLGAGGRIEIIVRSSIRNGKRFCISRKYPDPVIIKDDSGNVSHYDINDILPEIEIFGQNEILEIAQDKENVFKLIQRFLPDSIKNSEASIADGERKIEANLERLLKAEENLSELQDKIAHLPKLEEEVKQYKDLGIENISMIVPKLERERSLIQRIQEELNRVSIGIKTIEENLPDTIFLSDNALQDLPHKTDFKTIRESLDRLETSLNEQIIIMKSNTADASTRIQGSISEINQLIRNEEEILEKTFKNLPSLEGKAGKDIGITYQNLLKRIEQIRPLESQIKTLDKSREAIKQERQNILADLSELKSKRNSELQRGIKSLTKRLEGKMRVSLVPEGNRRPLKDYLLACELEGIGERRLSWIDSAEALSPLSLVKAIKEGKDALLNSGWGITQNSAEALLRLPPSQLYRLEALKLGDLPKIELNISHDAEQYKDIENLSTGQQCTAILLLLLLENKDPLIMDQPEDNLDNAFIAERIVTELRASKIERQFIFATHNANIPIFGDAEWIGVLESTHEGAILPPEHQGSIDAGEVRDAAAKLHEGGKTAFMQRKEKYGY